MSDLHELTWWVERALHHAVVRAARAEFSEIEWVGYMGETDGGRLVAICPGCNPGALIRVTETGDHLQPSVTTVKLDRSAKVELNHPTPAHYHVVFGQCERCRRVLYAIQHLPFAPWSKTGDIPPHRRRLG